MPISDIFGNLFSDDEPFEDEDQVIIDRLDEKERQAKLEQSLNRAVKGNPERNAEIIELSNSQGLPRRTVERNFDEVKRKNQVELTNFEYLRKENPKLAEWITNYDNAAVAIDDVETLGGYEDILSIPDRPWYSLDFDKTFRNFDETFKELVGQTVRSMGVLGLDTAYTGDMQLMTKMIAPYVHDEADFTIEPSVMKATIPDVKPYDEKTYIRKPTLATLKPTMLMSLESDKDQFIREISDELFKEMRESDIRVQELTPDNLSILEQGIRSGVESTVLQAPGMALSMITGNPMFALMPMVGMEGARSYGEARKEGLSEAEATVFATTNAAIEYITEKIPVEQLIKITKGGSLKDMLGKTGRFAISEIGGEQLATLGQSLNEYGFDLDEEMNNATTTTEVLEIQGRRQAITLFAALTGSGTQGTIGFTVGSINNLIHKKRAAEFDGVMEHVIEQEKIDNLITLSQSVKMQEHSPEKLKEFIESVDDGARIYIPAKKLQELIDTGMELPEIITNNIQDSAATGGDLELGIGDFATLLAPNEDLMTELRPHLRMKAQSQVEFEKQDESLKALLERAQESEDLMTEADEIYNEIQEQLIATGRQSRSTARHSAQIIPAYVAVKAKEHNMGVREVYEMMGLKVQGPATKTPVKEVDPVGNILNTPALSSTKVNVTTTIEETGETVTYQEDAGVAIQDVQERIELTQRLTECLGS